MVTGSAARARCSAVRGRKKYQQAWRSDGSVKSGSSKESGIEIKISDRKILAAKMIGEANEEHRYHGGTALAAAYKRIESGKTPRARALKA